MYPYNTTATTYPQTEDTQTTLKRDERMIALLWMAMQEAVQSAKVYEQMMTTEELLGERAMLKAMYADEKKHEKLIQEALYLMQEQSEPNMIAQEVGAVDGALVEDWMRRELDQVDFYRALYTATPFVEMRDLFYEIGTDKQSHATALSHLYHKYYH